MQHNAKENQIASDLCLRRYNLLVLFGTLGQTNYSCSIQLIVETTTTHNFLKIKSGRSRLPAVKKKLLAVWEGQWK